MKGFYTVKREEEVKNNYKGGHANYEKTRTDESKICLKRLTCLWTDLKILE